MPRTALEVRQQPGGLFSIEDVAFSTGQRYFVSSTTPAGTDAVGYGTSPDAPVATLAYALANLVTANQGDIVLVMPNHAENIAGAAGILANKAGVQIIGLGKGRNRPVISYITNAAASFDVTAANVHIENIVFRPVGVAAVTAAINVQAADCEIVNCDIEHSTATNQAALGILTTAAGTRLLVQGCRFFGSNNAGTNAAIRIVGGDGHTIRDNTFSGSYAAGTGPIENVTTACTNAIVEGNRIQNLTAVATKAMVFVATSTGQISRNYMQILSGTAPITGAAMSWVGGNYYAAVVATAGSLI